MNAAEIVKKSPGPAIATDAENRIVELNRASVDLIGHNRKEALGRNLHHLLHVRDTSGNRLNAQQFAFYEMVSRSEPVRSINVEVCRASGERVKVSISVIVVLGSTPTDYNVVYQLRPIYRRRKADEAIERILRRRPDEDPLELRGQGSPDVAPDLTRRQLEVLRLMTRGASAQEISNALGISINTVRTHIQRILRRLNAHSQLEAVAAAFRERLI